MNLYDFSDMLFKAINDPDEELAGLARNVKAAIEREDMDAAQAGIIQMAGRMRHFRLERSETSCVELRTAADARQAFGAGSWLGENTAAMLERGNGPMRIVQPPHRAGWSPPGGGERRPPTLIEQLEVARAVITEAKQACQAERLPGEPLADTVKRMVVELNELRSRSGSYDPEGAQHEGQGDEQ
jgi:hypothetical protein